MDRKSRTMTVRVCAQENALSMLKMASRHTHTHQASAQLGSCSHGVELCISPVMAHLRFAEASPAATSCQARFMQRKAIPVCVYLICTLTSQLPMYPICHLWTLLLSDCSTFRLSFEADHGYLSFGLCWEHEEVDSPAFANS